MRILADLRSLQDPNFAGRGIGSHAAGLLRGLRHGAADDVEIVGLVDPAFGPPAEEHRGLCDATSPAFVPPDATTPCVFLALSPLTHDTLLPARLLDRGHVMPVAVVYDFIPAEHPDRHLPDAAARRAYAAALAWLPAYRAFFPISEPVAMGLERRLGVARRRIVVTGVAVREPFLAAAPPPPGDDDVILFVGGADRRKNLDTVIAAHARLARHGRRPVRLVVAGGYPPAWQEEARRAASLAGGDPSRIAFLERIGDSELAGWYARARATVIASLAEGFSLPVVEAIAAGGVAIVSDIPPHRCLVDAPEALFPATDAATLADRLAAVLDAPAIRGRLADAQAPVARSFTAEAVGRRFTEGLRRHFDSFLRRHARRGRPARRAVVAIASPFPPDRSGVADYTLQCVEALGRTVDVDVYTEQPAPVRAAGVRGIHPLSAAAWLRPDYDATIAIIGNSPFHRRIVDFHARFGGPCILHDGRMSDFYVWRDGLPAGRAIAERELGRPVNDDEVRGWLAAPDALPTPFLSGILANARPAIVHSRPLARHVEQTLGQRVETLPFCIYRQLADDRLSAAGRRDARRTLGVAADTVLVVSLGWVIPSKAPERVVDAVALLRRRGVPAHLRFVGNPGPHAERLASRADPGTVSFTTDWVSEDDYRLHLQAADYAVQLRTVRSGAISGGLMDCIAAGLPTVANHDLAEAVDAPGYVLRVADVLDPGEIADRLAAAVAAGGHAGRHDAARRAYAAGHSFDAYAAGLLGLLGVTSTSASRASSRRG